MIRISTEQILMTIVAGLNATRTIKKEDGTEVTEPALCLKTNAAGVSELLIPFEFLAAVADQQPVVDIGEYRIHATQPAPDGIAIRVSPPTTQKRIITA